MAESSNMKLRGNFWATQLLNGGVYALPPGCVKLSAAVTGSNKTSKSAIVIRRKVVKKCFVGKDHTTDQLG